MKNSETFGIEKGHGREVVEWLNNQAQELGMKFEARLYGYELDTSNFGKYEMFSWIGDVKFARKLIIKTSKRFKIKVIEGGYKTKERIFHTKKSDYVIVRDSDKVIGHLELEASRFTRGNWRVKAEERR